MNIKTTDLWQGGFLGFETVIKGAIVDGAPHAYDAVDIVRNCHATYNRPDCTDYSNAVVFNKGGRVARVALFHADKSFVKNVTDLLDEKLIANVIDAGQPRGNEFRPDMEFASADRPELLADFINGNLIPGLDQKVLHRFRFAQNNPHNLVGKLGKYSLDIPHRNTVDLGFADETWRVGIQSHGTVTGENVYKHMAMSIIK